MMKSNTPTGASSATYRTAVNKLAKKLKRKPIHTNRPSFDFEEMIDEILPEAMKEKALEWYQRGIKRGMDKATDLMVSGKIHRKGEVVYAPEKMKVRVRTKFSGEDWENHLFLIRSKEIGFKS